MKKDGDEVELAEEGVDQMEGEWNRQRVDKWQDKETFHTDAETLLRQQVGTDKNEIDDDDDDDNEDDKSQAPHGNTYRGSTPLKHCERLRDGIAWSGAVWRIKGALGDPRGTVVMMRWR